MVYDSTSNEFYASNPDEATGTKLDLEDLPKETHGDGSNQNEEPIVDTELGLGPQGITRLYNSERFISSTAKLDLGKDLGTDKPDYSPSSDSTLQDCEFRDNIDFNTDLNVARLGFLVFCIAHYNTQATAGYACSYGAESGITPSVSNSDRIRFLNAAFNGDMVRVKEILKETTANLSVGFTTMPIVY